MMTYFLESIFYAPGRYTAAHVLNNCTTAFRKRPLVSVESRTAVTESTPIAFEALVFPKSRGGKSK